MIDGNSVCIFESMFDGGDGYFKGIMEQVYRGDVGCGFGTSCDVNNSTTLDEGWWDRSWLYGTPRTHNISGLSLALQ